MNDDQALEHEADVMGAQVHSQMHQQRVITLQRPPLQRVGATPPVSSSRLQGNGVLNVNGATMYPLVIQRRVVIRPVHYARGLGFEDPGALPREAWAEYYNIVVRDELEYVQQFATEEESRAIKEALKTLGKTAKNNRWELHAAEMEKMIKLINFIDERLGPRTKEDEPGFGQGTNRYSVAPENYRHTPLKGGRQSTWKDDPAMYKDIAESLGPTLGDEKGLRSQARGKHQPPLSKIPWELAKQVLPRPLINLIFDIYFQLYDENLVPVDERTASQRENRKATANTPGSLRSYHMDTPEALPSTAKSARFPGAELLHRHYTKTSQGGSGSSQKSAKKDGPIGYAEYTGTGSKSEHYTKVVLDYYQGRVYLTLTHYQYPILYKEGGRFHIINSGSQKIADAEGRANTLKGRDPVILSPWVEIQMPDVSTFAKATSRAEKTGSPGVSGKGINESKQGEIERDAKDTITGVRYHDEVFSVQQVTDDGDCFYKSCLDYINAHKGLFPHIQPLPESVDEIRGRLAEASNIAEIRNPKEYATMDEHIPAMANWLQKPIVLHLGTHDKPTTEPHPIGNEYQGEPIHLLFLHLLGKGHIQPMTRK